MSNVSAQLALSFFSPTAVVHEGSIGSARASSPLVKPVWGLKKADLKVLDFHVLNKIFRGLHNLVVPNAIADNMNPNELIAKYAGATLLKRGNKHFGRKYDFLGLVRALDRVAYPILGKMLARTKDRNFGAEQGMQLTRLVSLDDSLKARFLDSFSAPYAVSNRENRGTFDYHDPNCDGKDAGIYVDRIFDKLKDRQANPKL